MMLTLAQAAAATGRSRSTLLRAIRKGQISASRDAAGGFLVDESELARVFPIRDPDVADDHQLPSLAEALARLDEERSERRQTADRLAAAQERIAALLTDQRTPPPAPARRSWWPWRRR
jgi:hypothetical protein